MQFDDVEKLLDMRIIFAYSGNLPVADFAKKFNLSFQSALHFGNNKLELSYFIPEELGENREFSIFLAQSRATKEGNVYFVNYSLSQQALFNALTKHVITGKSTVVDSMLLTGGNYLLSCRFHSNELNFFSSALLENVNVLEGLGVRYMGPNPGMETILSEIRNSVGLRYMEWEVNVPEKDLSGEPFSRLPEEWVMETRYMTTGESLSAVVRTSSPVADPVKNGFSVLSENDNFYEMPLNNLPPFLKYYFSNTYESRLVRFRRAMHFSNGVLRFNVIIPVVLSDNIIGVLSRFQAEFPDLGLTLKKIYDL